MVIAQISKIKAPGQILDPGHPDKTGDSGDYIKMEYETGTEIPRLPTKPEIN